MFLQLSVHLLSQLQTMELWDGEFNQAADVTYGLICMTCCFVGTLGNIFSFFFFKAKKRDISTVIYMLITGCDIVISILVLPVGISLLSQRNPGLIFGNKISCVAWSHIWMNAVALSTFLVICLSITRTMSLLKPFKPLSRRKLCVAVLVHSVLTPVPALWYHVVGGFKVAFSAYTSQCIATFLPFKDNRMLFYLMVIGRTILIVAPLLVVTISCLMSAVILIRKNKDVQQRELQQSKNRATLTILLFALLFAICNTPLILHVIMLTVHFYGMNWDWLFDVLYEFDKSGYYFTAISTLLIAANSAVNPILYLCRMHRLRDYVVAELRKYFKVLRGLYRLNRVTMETGNDVQVVVEE